MQEFIKFKSSVKLLLLSFGLMVGFIVSVYVPFISELMENNNSLVMFIFLGTKLFFAICFWIVAVRIYFLAKILKEKNIISHRSGILVFGWVACSLIPIVLHAVYLFYLWKQGGKLEGQ